MYRNKNKLSLSFHVEGESEQELIEILAKKYHLRKMVTINKPNIVGGGNVSKIINFILRIENKIESSDNRFIILILDEKSGSNKVGKTMGINLIFTSKPCLDYIVGKSLNIKSININDTEAIIKKKVMKFLKICNKNYLKHSNQITNLIDFDILIDELGKLGEIILLISKKVEIVNSSGKINYNGMTQKLKQEIEAIIENQ